MTLVDELKNAGMSETDIRLFIGSLHRAVCFMCCKTPCSRCILNCTDHCKSVGNMSKELYLSLTDDMQKHPEVYEL